MKSKIIFLHSMKTGGTTLNGIVDKLYRSKSIYKIGANRVESTNQLIALPQDKKDELEFITGHMYYGLHNHLGECEYITILRNPIERAISTYYHVLDRDYHPWNPTLVDENLSLIDYVEKDMMAANNHQTIMISGFSEIEFKENPQKALLVAMENLDKKFSAIGITERFDEFVILLNKKFGWNIQEFEKLNVRGKEYNVSISERKIIEEHNKQDLELYEYANQKMTKMMLDKIHIHSISYPRSGHHILMACLKDYFGDRMHYCEYYTHCQTTPCPEGGSEINIQKSHDNQLDEIISPTKRYILQYRNPIKSLVSQCYNHEKYVWNKESTFEEWETFSNYKMELWEGFMKKWAQGNKEYNLLHLLYEDFLTDPKNFLEKTIKYINPTEVLDSSKLDKILKERKIEPKRNIEDFHHYNKEHFDFLEGKVEYILKQFKIPRYNGEIY